jgi:glucose-6-phosphate 1-epimerase
MATCRELNEEFGIEGVLAFDEPHPGFLRALVTTAACTAELYLHGAHLTQWQPAGQSPVLYLSPRTNYAPGKAIRGGVPVIFPWFGARTAEVTGARTDGPQHGFARTAAWQLGFAALLGDELRLTLALSPSEASRAAGFDSFRAALELALGSTLTMRLSVANDGSAPLVFEEALHTYPHVGDARQVRLLGLDTTEYLDKTENFARKRQTEAALTLEGEVDRPYLNTERTVTVEDPVLRRRIVVAKGGSRTTVVWNPGAELAAKLADLGPDAWREFVCVETANVGENRITLPAQSAHVMETRIAVEPLG